MVRWTAGIGGHCLETQCRKIKTIDKCIDDSNSVFFANVIVQAIGE